MQHINIYLFIVTRYNMYTVWNYKGVSFAQFDNVCPSYNQFCFSCKYVSIKAHVIYRQIKPSLSRKSRFPVTKRKIYRLII